MRQADNDQSFLGRVFDAYQNMMQIAACIREAARQQAIRQPRVLELSRRATDLGDYLPEAQITRFATHQNNQPTLGAPVVLPFADNSFDSCLISDVYEHIPAKRRPELLREMLRVTNGLVLVASPQGDEIVTRFDRIVFDFIWGKYGERFEPLEQHMGFGLEPLEQTLESLKAQGADQVIALPGNYVYRWIHLILIYFDQQHRNNYGHLFEPFNRIYNQYLSPFDYREPCYRYLIAIATHDAVDVEALHVALKKPCETAARVKETDALLVQTFREIEASAADQLRRCAREIAQLREENERNAREIERRDAEIIRLWSELEARQVETETSERARVTIEELMATRLGKMEQLQVLADERERALTDILNSKSFQVTIFYGRLRRTVRRVWQKLFSPER